MVSDALFALLVLAVVVVGAAAVRVGTAASRIERSVLESVAFATFAPLLLRARDDARLMPALDRLARAARKLHPDLFARIDRAYDASFPLGASDFRTAHERWTAEWLAWERTHDAEYKLRAEQLEAMLRQSGELDTAVGRGRLAAVEREKLERYQQRYEEYIRLAKDLDALAGSGAPGRT